MPIKIARFNRLLMAGVGAAVLSACDDKTQAPVDNSEAIETAEPQEPEIDYAVLLAATAADHAGAVLQESPEFATVLGVGEDIAGEGFAAKLGGYGFEATQRARELNERFLQDIRGVERKDIGAAGQITYDALRHAYETAAQRNQFAFGGAAVFGSSGPYVLTQLSGAHLFLPRLLLTQHPMNSKQDAENYLSRLSEFGRVFDEVSESIGADAALGIVPPTFAIAGARRSITGFTGGLVADNPLTATFAEKLDAIEGLSDEERDKMKTRAGELVESIVYPAYARLDAALENIEGQSNGDAGIWRLGDDSAAFYQHRLDAYGASGKTGEEIHQLGLSEVARITAEMDAILQAEGSSDGAVAKRFEEIGVRDGMQYPNTDEGRAELLGDLNDQVNEIMARAPDWFGTTPAQSVEVRRIPEYEQDSAPGGYYNSPSMDGSRPGIYWINLKNTADWPKHTLKTLTYHEAVPGHHFQRSLERAAGLPLIRNMLGYSEFSEGWALYAEQVAAEMGMYDDDPFGNLGRLQSELFRAARLVVDSGLHDKRWTREQAIDYMQSVTGDTRDAVTREVERYSVWPGQACAYKLGMLKINELRERAETELGETFDIRKFHDEILLTGAMPLPVLEKKVDAWVATQKAS